MREQLPELPPNWAWVRLGEIATLIRNGLSTKPDGEAGTPILRISAVRAGRLDLNDVRYIGSDDAALDAFTVCGGDVLFTRYNGTRELVGVAAVVPPIAVRMLHPDKLIKVRLATDVCSPKYLSWAANIGASRRFVESRIRTTAGQAGISGGDLRELPVPIAPRREQDRIVAAIEQHLSDIDAGVAALERVQANLKRYRSSVLKAACEGRLVPTEAELARKEKRDYEPADVLLARILKERRARWEADQLAKMNAKGQVPRDDKWKAKYEEPQGPEESAPRELPEGWGWTSIDALIREPLRNGHSAPAVESEQQNGVRTLTLTAVTLGAFIEANTKLTTADSGRVQDLWLEPDDILVQRSNTPELVGTSRRFPGPTRFAIFPDLLIRVRFVEGVLARYAELVLQSGRVRSYFRRRAQGIAGSMPKIDQAVVGAAAIPLPPFADQQRIVAEVDRLLAATDAIEHTVRAQIARARRLREAVLKHAFEGKLVPQDSTDEPASVLLERIRAANTHDKPQNAPRRGRKPRVVEAEGEGAE